MLDVLKMNAANERLRLSSQQNPRVKETLSKPTAMRILPETNSDLVQLSSDISKDHARTCDVCRRSETILNPILVCTSCKVGSATPTVYPLLNLFLSSISLVHRLLFTWIAIEV